MTLNDDWPPHRLRPRLLFSTPPPSALAQPRQYRVLEIERPAQTIGITPLGINDDGVVVGQVERANQVGDSYAFVWFPAPLYGFNLCGGPHNLHDLVPATPAGDSIAYEVNRTVFFGQTVYPGGQIAGQVAGVDGDAFVWTFAAGNATTVNLSSFTGGGILTTIAARGISDASPAVVVGEAEWEILCQGNPKVADVGFRATLDGAEALEALLPPVGDDDSFARDVSTSSSSLGVGFSEPGPNPTSCLDDVSPCEGGVEALTWSAPSAPLSLQRISPPSGAQALGINDAGDIVGYSVNNLGGCPRNASLWRAGDHELVILGQQDPLQGDEVTLANAINDADPLQIVGPFADGILIRGYLWEESAGGGFDVVDLDDAACDCGGAVLLREALDVNESGWIVARSLTRAFLLRPVDECPADLNGDGFVDVKDLNILVMNWGPCVGDCQDMCCECLGDIGGNCVRDAQDQALLIASRGPCPGFGDCIPGEPEGASAPPPSLEDGIKLLGFAGVDDYITWLAEASDDEALAIGLLLVESVSP